MRVTCLGPDPRAYGQRRAELLGRDVLLLAPRSTLEQVEAQIGPVFDYLEPLPPLVLRHAGRPAMVIPLFLGHTLRVRPVRRLRA